MVLELVVLGLLVGLPIEFPAEGTAWGFLAQHPTFALHALVGAVVLVEAVLFVAAIFAGSSVTGRRQSLVIGGCGLACVFIAFGAGTVYVSDGQHGPSLNLMTAGWVGALAAYITGWVAGRRARARGQHPAFQRPGGSPAAE